MIRALAVLVFALLPLAAQIALPIEVFGPGVGVKSASFPAASVAAVPLRFTILADNVGYSDQASVRFNGGPWRFLTDARVVDGPCRDHGGLGGGCFVVEFSFGLPAGTLGDGINTIEFRQGHLAETSDGGALVARWTDGYKDNWRVLGFQFYRSDNRPVLDTNALFTWTTPGQEPVTGNAATGANLFNLGALISPAHGGVGPDRTLRARCVS